MASRTPTLNDFLRGKSPHTLALFDHFVSSFRVVGAITLHPAKTMIGIATQRKRIAYITRLGKDFIHVVFPFQRPYYDNLCFQKIAQVPGTSQYNHHFRMLHLEDVTDEVIQFMKLAWEEGT
ncbi:MAG: DUF5655 domain-containing protein [Bacteroidota bacterium]|jgi:hypothetical protein|nr:MAG: hypothetical protein DIU61_10720 [Bacteroidota bacterium]